jgi:hypothetical protein
MSFAAASSDDASTSPAQSTSASKSTAALMGAEKMCNYRGLLSLPEKLRQLERNKLRIRAKRRALLDDPVKLAEYRQKDKERKRNKTKK